MIWTTMVDIDVVVNDLDGPPQLLRNDGGNRNNSAARENDRHEKQSRWHWCAREGDLRRPDAGRRSPERRTATYRRMISGCISASRSGLTVDLIEVRWLQRRSRYRDSVSARTKL